MALARNTDGVKNVSSELEVRAGETTKAPDIPQLPKVRTLEQAAQDALITTTIQLQYFLDDQVKAHSIDVKTSKGVVTLTGDVSGDALKRQAEQIASDTPGVSRVVNQIKVSKG